MCRVTMVLLFLGSAALCHAGDIPLRHMISNIHQFDEITGLNCGPAALESVFAHFGPDVDQREIADVARTSSIGTYVFDMMRAGHFSASSGAQGRFFPAAVSAHGYTGRGLGYASFGHAQASPWLDGLKSLVAQDIPPVLLMLFTPEPGSGGHYRILVGYDDLVQTAYFIDPWGRSNDRIANADGTVSWSYADLLAAWNYADYGSAFPYFAMISLPWDIVLETRGQALDGKSFQLSARVTYPCPAPFDCSQSPAFNSVLQISLPSGLYLVNQPERIELGTVAAGASLMVTWKIAVSGVLDAGASLQVTAQGEVSGAVPAAAWEGEVVSYPPYLYTDRIGGVARYALLP